MKKVLWSVICIMTTVGLISCSTEKKTETQESEESSYYEGWFLNNPKSHETKKLDEVKGKPNFRPFLYQTKNGDNLHFVNNTKELELHFQLQTDEFMPACTLMPQDKDFFLKSFNIEFYNVKNELVKKISVNPLEAHGSIGTTTIYIQSEEITDKIMNYVILQKGFVRFVIGSVKEIANDYEIKVSCINN